MNRILNKVIGVLMLFVFVFLFSPVKDIKAYTLYNNYSLANDYSTVWCTRCNYDNQLNFVSNNKVGTVSYTNGYTGFDIVLYDKTAGNVVLNGPYSPYNALCGRFGYDANKKIVELNIIRLKLIENHAYYIKVSPFSGTLTNDLYTCNNSVEMEFVYQYQSPVTMLNYTGNKDVQISNISYNRLTNTLTFSAVGVNGFIIKSVSLDMVDIYVANADNPAFSLSHVCPDNPFSWSSGTGTVQFLSNFSPGSHLIGFTFTGIDGSTVKKGFSFDVSDVPSQGLENFEVFWQLNPTNSSYRTGNFLILYNYGGLEEKDFNYNNVLEAKKTNNPENLTNNSWCIVGISNISDPHDDGEFGVRWFSYSTWEAHANIVGASDNYQAFIAIRNNNGDIVYLTYDFTFDASSYGIFDNNGYNTGTGETLPNEEKTFLQKIWSLINDFFNMIKMIVNFIVAILTAFGSIVGFLVSGVIASLKFVIGTFLSFFSVVSGYNYSYVSVYSVVGAISKQGFFPALSSSSIDSVLQIFISNYIRSSTASLIFSVVAVILFIQKYVIKRGDES